MGGEMEKRRKVAAGGREEGRGLESRRGQVDPCPWGGNGYLTCGCFGSGAKDEREILHSILHRLHHTIYKTARGGVGGG